MVPTKNLLNTLGAQCKRMIDLRTQLYAGKITIEEFSEEADSIAQLISGIVTTFKKNIKKGDRVIR